MKLTFNIKRQNKKYYISALTGKVNKAWLIQFFESNKILLHLPSNVSGSFYATIIFQTEADAQNFIEIMDSFYVMKKLTQ